MTQECGPDATTTSIVDAIRELRDPGLGSSGPEFIKRNWHW